MSSLLRVAGALADGYLTSGDERMLSIYTRETYEETVIFFLPHAICLTKQIKSRETCKFLIVWSSSEFRTNLH